LLARNTEAIAHTQYLTGNEPGTPAREEVNGVGCEDASTLRDASTGRGFPDARGRSGNDDPPPFQFALP